jgi:hypothetical protein
MKLKVTDPTRTIWLQETKQIVVELEDKRVLGIRVMEDDNGSEQYFALKQPGEEIYKRDEAWTSDREMEWESEELAKAVDKFAATLFFGDSEKDEIIDTDELEDVW